MVFCLKKPCQINACQTVSSVPCTVVLSTPALACHPTCERDMGLSIPGLHPDRSGLNLQQSVFRRCRSQASIQIPDGCESGTQNLCLLSPATQTNPTL